MKECVTECDTWSHLNRGCVVRECVTEHDSEAAAPRRLKTLRDGQSGPSV